MLPPSYRGYRLFRKWLGKVLSLVNLVFSTMCVIGVVFMFRKTVIVLLYLKTIKVLLCSKQSQGKHARTQAHRHTDSHRVLMI